MAPISWGRLALFVGSLALLTVALTSPSPVALLLMPQTGPFVTAVVAVAVLAWTMTQEGWHTTRRLSPVRKPDGLPRARGC